MNENHHSCGERPEGALDLERALRSFAPDPPALDRDRLMFLAGRADAQAARGDAQPAASGKFWPALALLSMATSFALALMLWQRPTERIVVERDPIDRGLATTEQPAMVEPMAAPVAAERNKSDVPSILVVRVVDRPTAPTERHYVAERNRLLRGDPKPLAAVAPLPTAAGGRPATQRELLKEFQRPHTSSVSTVVPDAWWKPWLNPGDQS
jgi:hypothetical protein